MAVSTSAPRVRKAPPLTHDQLRAAGDLDLDGLFRQHQADLVRLAVLLVRDQPTAEDVVQDVFARLHENPRLRARTGEELAYIRASVINGCRSVLRRRSVAQRLSKFQDMRERSDPSAETEVILAEDRRQVLAALASLPRRRREVLVLRYYLGLTEAQIAATLGISPGTVKSTAARGIAAMARALGEEW
jgi:RNA polymerase sigma-70 factor (sigma-E family)